MASPFENRRVAYHKIVRFNNSYGIRNFCDEQALNSLHFLTAHRQGFCVQLLLGRAAKRLHPTPAVQVVNEGTRPRSNTSETRLRRAARKILPFEEDDAPYRRDHSPAGGRTLRGMRSCGPIAVSTLIISRFGLRLDDSFSGEWPPGAGSAAGSAFISTRCALPTA